MYWILVWEDLLCLGAVPCEGNYYFGIFSLPCMCSNPWIWSRLPFTSVCGHCTLCAQAVPRRLPSVSWLIGTFTLECLELNWLLLIQHFIVLTFHTCRECEWGGCGAFYPSSWQWGLPGCCSPRQQQGRHCRQSSCVSPFTCITSRNSNLFQQLMLSWLSFYLLCCFVFCCDVCLQRGVLWAGTELPASLSLESRAVQNEVCVVVHMTDASC